MVEAKPVNRKHRHLWVCAGVQSKVYTWLAEHWFAQLSSWQGLYLGSDMPPDELGSLPSQQLECIQSSKIETILGREFDYVIVDAFLGLNPNALGAVSGTLRAGGKLLLLCPELDQWSQYADPDYARFLSWPYSAKDATGIFLQRVASILESACSNSQYPAISKIDLDKALSPSHFIEDQHCIEGIDSTSACQDKAIHALKKVVTGHRNRPVVLTADRGRGKSAALGMAAAELLVSGVSNILITAPSRKTVSTLFKHLRMRLDELSDDQNIASELFGKCTFMAPDWLARELPLTDWLIVDEAAALPVNILERFLNNYSRLAFATTQHGYEGTGRGFTIRFKALLDQQTPQWNEVVLKEPIRWVSGDPLEAITDRLLLLGATESDGDCIEKIHRDDCYFEVLDRSDWQENERIFNDLFGLLVSAHYQTRPSDYRWMLDSPDVSIVYLRYQEMIVATAVTIREGGFPQGLSNHIDNGKRRPKGHLVAQGLAATAGISGASTLINERIVRIAVHSSCRRMGLGKQLLEFIEDKTKSEQSIDYLATSFGATSDLIGFWKAYDYQAVRVGTRRDKSSGTHSVIMMKPVTVAGNDLQNRAERRFIAHMPCLLARQYPDMESNMVRKLLEGKRLDHSWSLSAEDKQDIEAYLVGRAYETSEYAVVKLLFRVLTAHGNSINQVCTEEDCNCLVDWVLFGREKLYRQREALVMGKKAKHQKLRLLIDQIYQSVK